MSLQQFPKAPEHEIHWGMIATNCEAEMKEWVGKIITMVKLGQASVDDAAAEIYEEVRSIGYSEGYDSAQADADPEGW